MELLLSENGGIKGVWITQVAPYDIFKVITTILSTQKGLFYNSLQIFCMKHLFSAAKTHDMMCTKSNHIKPNVENFCIP